MRQAICRISIKKEDVMFEFDYTMDSSAMFAGRKSILKKFYWIYILIPLVPVAEYIIKFVKTRDVTHLVTCAIYIVLICTTFYLFIKLSKKLSKKNNSDFLGQKVSMTVSDSGIHIKAEKEGKFESTQTYQWNTICKFKQDDSYYFLYLSKLRTHVIPKGSCASGNEGDFAAFVEQKLNENKLTENKSESK